MCVRLCVRMRKKKRVKKHHSFGFYIDVSPQPGGFFFCWLKCRFCFFNSS